MVDEPNGNVERSFHFDSPLRGCPVRGAEEISGSVTPGRGSPRHLLGLSGAFQCLAIHSPLGGGEGGLCCAGSAGTKAACRWRGHR
jgi:hypothetical protein